MPNTPFDMDDDLPSPAGKPVQPPRQKNTSRLSHSLIPKAWMQDWKPNQEDIDQVLASGRPPEAK